MDLLLVESRTNTSTFTGEFPYLLLDLQKMMIPLQPESYTYIYNKLDEEIDILVCCKCLQGIFSACIT